MRDDLSGEQCVLCSTAAAVRVSGTSFCAPCGLQQYSGATAGAVRGQRRSRRTAIVGVLSSSFLLKMLLGAVAVAAVGGVAASSVPNGDALRPVSTTAIEAGTMPPASTTNPEAVASVPATLAFPEVVPEVAVGAHEYAAAIQVWAECVSEAASAHSGGPFDPMAACPDKPRPGDFDLPVGDAPGHDEDGPGSSEDAPGHDEDGPGSSEDAPGHDEDGPGNSENAPGNNKPPKDEKDK